MVDHLSRVDPAGRPVAVLTKNADPDLYQEAERAGIAVVELHAQARAETVLSTVRSLLEWAVTRPATEAALTGSRPSRSPTSTAWLSGWPR